MPSHADRVRRHYAEDWWKPWWERHSTHQRVIWAVLAAALLYDLFVRVRL